MRRGRVLMYMEPLAHRLYLTVIAPCFKLYVRTDTKSIIINVLILRRMGARRVRHESARYEWLSKILIVCVS